MLFKTYKKDGKTIVFHKEDKILGEIQEGKKCLYYANYTFKNEIMLIIAFFCLFAVVVALAGIFGGPTAAMFFAAVYIFPLFAITMIFYELEAWLSSKPGRFLKSPLFLGSHEEVINAIQNNTISTEQVFELHGKWDDVCEADQKVEEADQLLREADTDSPLYQELLNKRKQLHEDSLKKEKIIEHTLHQIAKKQKDDKALEFLNAA